MTGNGEAPDLVQTTFGQQAGAGPISKPCDRHSLSPSDGQRLQ